MRRAMPRGRGTRPMPRPPNSRPSDGPLMTDHLQGLKDIDMELDLLKRKREIIEQQQEMLSGNFRSRDDYEQPMFSESRDDRYNDYPRSYEDSRDSNFGGGGAPNRKRHIQVWDNELPVKRFPGPNREDTRKGFGSRLGPPPNNPRPRPSNFQPNAGRYSAPKPYKPRPAPPAPPLKKRDFNPTKVTKPSAAPAPFTKLKGYQPAERKRLVQEASNMTSKASAPFRAPPALTKAAAATSEDMWTLRADRDPTPQMIGRLELALGAVMKETKLANPEYEYLFNLAGPSRAMKQVVRERIRTAMIGKLVTTRDNIKAIYYDKFPSETDNDVVLKGLEAHQDTDFIPVKSDDPETYFKKNMSRLILMKFEEMVNKLEEVYCEKNPCYHLPSKKVKNQAKFNTHGAHSKAGSVDNTELQSQTGGSQSQTDEMTDVGEIDFATDDYQLNIDKSQPVDTQVPTEEFEPAAASKEVNLPAMINIDLYKALDKLMTFKMAHLLKKFAPAMLRVIDIDAMYRKTKANIQDEIRRKLEGPLAQTLPTNASKKSPQKRSYQPLQYFVKILGKPSLPKRKAMESFFEEYKPKSIKKHRTVHNLLFVGFTEKESYDRMLAADGTVIGRFTLDIKVSERNVKKAENEDSAIVVQDHKPDTATEENQKASDPSSDDHVIEKELDDQITDLLTSIRKSEELDNSSDEMVIYEPPDGDENKEVKEDSNDAMVCDPPKEVVKEETIDNSNDLDDVVHFEDVPQPEVKDQPEVNNQSDVKDPPEVKNEPDVEVQPDEKDQSDVKNQPEAKDQSETKIQPDVETAHTDDKTKIDEARKEEAEKKDTVGALKTEAKEVKGTPTRSSARLATPIRTRRSSKLLQ